MEQIVLHPIEIMHRWRVGENSGRFILRDENNNVWKNGEELRDLYISDYDRWLDRVSAATEGEAWAGVPKSGYTILPPETPLYRFALENTGVVYVTVDEADSMRSAFSRGVRELAIHALDGRIVLVDMNKYPVVVFQPSP